MWGKIQKSIIHFVPSNEESKPRRNSKVNKLETFHQILFQMWSQMEII